MSKRMSILIVEDEPGTRELMDQLLRAHGYRTEVAEDGLAALDRIGPFKPDLIISDLQMPRLSGMELLEKVRAVHPAIKFIMVTAFGDIETAVKSIKLGAFNFLQKPISMGQLLAQLQACLEPERALRVFLCHCSADKASVRRLFVRLRRDGFDPWLDEKKLKPGDDWQLEIKKAVRNSDVVVVCLSQNSITKSGFVQTEIKTALDVTEEKPDETVFIIPARLEFCDVPERLRRWQWVDLYAAQGYAKLIGSLRMRYKASGPN
jgi:DNA-binding response OmpR family regulator